MTEGNSNGSNNGAPAKAVTGGGTANMYQQMSAVMNQSQAHSQPTGVYLNPHAAAQAAVAFTAAAQQLVQAQMQQQQQQPLTNGVVSQQTNHSFTPMQLDVQTQQNTPFQVPVESSNVAPASTFAQPSLSQVQSPNATPNSPQAPAPSNL